MFVSAYLTFNSEIELFKPSVSRLHDVMTRR